MMQGGFKRAKEYHLHDEKNELQVSVRSRRTGRLSVTVKEGTTERRFSGKQVGVVDAPLGTIASVILKQTPDLQTTTLSVVVPAANRPASERSIPIKTHAVRTTSRTSIGGPQMVEGQVQTYEIRKLEGNAW